MVCYSCGRGASAKCMKCHRYVCADHTHGRLCTGCQGLEESRFESFVKAIEQRKAKRRCAFCGARDETKYDASIYYSSPACHDFDKDDDWRNRRCRVCEKYFCPNCGTVSELKEGDHVYFWKRCRNHPRKRSHRISPPLLWLLGGYSQQDLEYWESPDDWRYD